MIFLLLSIWIWKKNVCENEDEYDVNELGNYPSFTCGFDVIDERLT